MTMKCLWVAQPGGGGLIYKEQHGNQWGELLIGCWEVKGLKLSSNFTNYLILSYMKVPVRNPLM